MNMVEMKERELKAVDLQKIHWWPDFATDPLPPFGLDEDQTREIMVRAMDSRIKYMEGKLQLESQLAQDMIGNYRATSEMMKRSMKEK